MVSAAVVMMSGWLLAGQTSQVGALYSGGDSARPKLNGDNCSQSIAVDVVYQVIVNTAVGTIPIGVIYTQDVPIPSSSAGASSSSGFIGGTTLTSPVTCGEPSAGSILRDDIPLAVTQTSINLSQMHPITIADLMRDLCESDEGVRVRRAVCLGIRNGQGGTTLARGGDGPDIDTQAPGLPTCVSLQAGDSIIEMRAGPPSDSDAVEKVLMRYVAEHRACTPAQSRVNVDAGTASSDGGSDDGGSVDAGIVDTTDECGAFARTAPGASPIEIDGLENGVSYEVRARAVDDFGNIGGATATAFATPVKEFGFLDLYGRDTYGLSCEHSGGAGAGVTVLGALVALFLRARRRQRSWEC